MRKCRRYGILVAGVMMATEVGYSADAVRSVVPGASVDGLNGKGLYGEEVGKKGEPSKQQGELNLDLGFQEVLAWEKTEGGRQELKEYSAMAQEIEKRLLELSEKIEKVESSRKERALSEEEALSESKALYEQYVADITVIIGNRSNYGFNVEDALYQTHFEVLRPESIKKLSSIVQKRLKY